MIIVMVIVMLLLGAAFLFLIIQKSSETMDGLAEQKLPPAPVPAAEVEELDSEMIDLALMTQELASMDTIIVDQPQAQALVSSPLTVSGQATGSWFFEASFPLRISLSHHKMERWGHRIPFPRFQT